MAGALYSNEESERPDRALAARRPWRDPRVNMHVCEVIFLFLILLIDLILSVILMLSNGVYCRIIS